MTEPRSPAAHLRLVLALFAIPVLATIIGQWRIARWTHLDPFELITAVSGPRLWSVAMSAAAVPRGTAEMILILASSFVLAGIAVGSISWFGGRWSRGSRTAASLLSGAATGVALGLGAALDIARFFSASYDPISLSVVACALAVAGGGAAFVGSYALLPRHSPRSRSRQTIRRMRWSERAR